ncbi:MAG: hypothetical protein M3N45_13495 [Actinomycetota bacterium]|nr:hypothetical protein [Actinomycetota bacterium]
MEVGRGAIRYRVAVQAESIRRALEIVEGMNPGKEIKVMFPIDPESFFVEESGAVAGQIEQEKQSAA